MSPPLEPASIAPVRHRLELPLPPASAFQLFTRSLARWWPLTSHSCGGEQALDVVFEERVGGAVVELTRDGQRHRWGTLLEWDPPHGFEMTWHPGQPESQATRVRVRFVATGDGGDGCELQLEHGGWEARGDDGPRVRDGYQQGWGEVLGRLAAAAREVHA